MTPSCILIHVLPSGRVTTRPPLNRLALRKFAVDLGLWGVLTPALALLLRTEEKWTVHAAATLRYALLNLPLVALVILAFGLHRQGWRKVGVHDARRLAAAAVVGTLGFLFVQAVLRAWAAPPQAPRSLPFLCGLVGFVCLASARVLARALHDQGRARRVGRSARRVLIAGAGDAGALIAGEMLRCPEAGLLPVAFLDDDRQKQGERLEGIPVIGRLDELERQASAVQADEVLIAIPSQPGAVTRRVVDQARAARLPYRIVPGALEVLGASRLSLTQIREVQLEDLLHREPVRLDGQEIAAYVAGRTVLVTGAGGSVGSELVRQVARFRPEALVLLGRGENSIFHISQELRRRAPEVTQHAVIADVRDLAALERVFQRFAPQVVFHAAAHKHVPLMEGNPREAILNNVAGTRNLTCVALEHGVTRLVNISSDKAVNPTSIMGASKRLAEHMVDLAARRAGPDQVFVSVRFGNVLGSRGSVVPTFKEQIRQGGPVTVTHPDMTRYFMTIPEATSLVLQAAGLGLNGARFVLDMGQPVKIADLARDLIRLSGFTPDADIPLTFTGIRPGEKLFEELLTAEEGTFATRHKKIFVANSTPLDLDDLEQRTERLLAAALAHDEELMVTLLRELIPTYTPRASSPALGRLLTPA